MQIVELPLNLLQLVYFVTKADLVFRIIAFCISYTNESAKCIFKPLSLCKHFP